MDLNDPRRRLAVARANNPSIRLSVAPRQNVQSTVKVEKVQPYQGQLKVAQPQQHDPISVVGPKPTVQRPEPQQFKFDFQKGLDSSIKAATEAPGKFFGTAGDILSDVVTGGINIAQQAGMGKEIGDGGTLNLGGNLDKFKQFAAEDLKSGKLTKQQYSAKVAEYDRLGRDIQQKTTATSVKYGKEYDPNSANVDMLATIAGGVPKFIPGIVKSVAKAGTGLFKGSAEKQVTQVVKSIVAETNPEVIQQTLKVEPAIAQYLATETNPVVVQDILRELAVDPSLNISPKVRQRLQEEGIKRVKQEDTEYGAAYSNDEISLKDQSYATDENLSHELGHHIFRNKLTPDERALFKGEGSASKSAAGRKDYTPEDINSEDFSDYLSKAMSGRIDEVPEALRDVVAKYARVAAKENTDTPTPTLLPKEYEDAIKEAGGTAPKITLPKTAKSEMGPAAQIDSAVKPTQPLPDIGPLPENQLDTQALTPQAVDEAIAKTQAGVSDAPVDGAVKTTSLDAPESGFVAKADETTGSGQKAATEAQTAPDATPVTKGIKFRDPETKKQIQRSYEDVEAELNALKNLPEDQIDSATNKKIKSLQDKMARFRSENAKYAYPDADDETRTAIQAVMDELNGASRLYNKAKKSESQELAVKAQAGKGAYADQGGGEQGFRAKLGALKGERSKSTYEPINANPEVQNKILDDIENSNLRDFEKLNTQNAMRKIWGANDKAPTKADINYIRKYFGDDMGNAVEEAVKDAPKDWRDRLVDIAGIPRAAMASFDMSMGLRQGGQVAVRNFPEWANANIESVKYVKDSKYFESEMKKIANSDEYELLTDKLGVRLPAVTGDSDEIMASAHILEKIPVYGRGIAASDRAYSGGLTKLRYNVAKQWIDSQGGIDEFAKKFSDKEMKDIGEVINTSTGSGGKPGGLTERHMQTLATTLFAPRLWASRLNAINPAYYARLTPVARKRAAENLSSFLAAAGGLVALTHAAGADVELDPRSADFMKPKVGNTRYDVMGGLQQNIVFAARMITGEKKNSQTGEIQTLSDGFGKPSRFDLAADMGTNKLNPLLGYAVKLLRSGESDSDNPLEREDKFGEPLNVATEASKLGIPLGVQGLGDTIDDTGDVAKAVAMNVPSFVGIGVQTYGETKSKDAGKPPTSLEERAKADAKASSESRKKFVESQSKEDQALMKLTDAKLQEYLDEGTIDQGKYDKIQNLQKGAETHGKPEKVPKELKTEQAKTFYKKWNSMNEKDQKYWLNEKPDDNAKSLATELNKTRSEGLSELKPSNKLAKAYAEYEKDIAAHPEYTTVDKRNKAKAFQVNAYKLNYSDSQRDIFTEGGSSDLKALIDEKQIDKKDLDEAIKMDDELFNSGLTGSLKFSKKFRSTYGYGAPSGGKGANKGYASGGSGGDKSKRAYLSDLLVSPKKVGTSALPSFSAKRRTAGISFKNVTPPKKSGKKVSINL